MYRATLFGSSEDDFQSSEVCENESIYFNITDLRNKGISWHFCSTPIMPTHFFVCAECEVVFIALHCNCHCLFSILQQHCRISRWGGGGREVSPWPLKIPLAFLLGKFTLLVLVSFHYFSHKTFGIFSLVFFKFSI